MPPYNCLEMGGITIDHAQIEAPIRRSVFSVLQQPEVFLEQLELDPCADEDVDQDVDPSVSSDSITSMHTGGSTIKKHVSFTELHIREHSVILGDHPCCTIGLPVTLDWVVEREVSVDLEDYEATRERRRSRTEMRLSLDDRRELLSDISDTDLRRVQRKLHRERPCTGRAKQAFFSSLGTEESTGIVGFSE